MRLRTRYTQRLPVTIGLRLDIPMFEGSGAKVLDLSGKGNHGTITDAVWTRDEKGVAMSFNGTSAYIDCGNDASLNITDAITIEAWVKPSTASEAGYIIARKNASDWNSTYAVYFNGATNKIIFYANGVANVQSNAVVTETNWIHIAVVATQGGTTYFYKNGEPAGSGSAPAWSASADNLLIGARKEGAGVVGLFHGAIDEVRIYAVALTASQIKRRYEQTKRDYVRAS